jgi:hypothetical protein
MFGKVTNEDHLVFDSTIAAKPSFSFGKRHSKERVVNPQVPSDFYGRESPGVGHYQWEES